MLIVKYDTVYGPADRNKRSGSFCYQELVVHCDRRLSNFRSFNVNKEIGGEFTRAITLKCFTPCNEINAVSTLINVKYSELFWGIIVVTDFSITLNFLYMT
jgi:hypothetical protein